MTIKTHVIEATVDPTATPTFVGQHWVNTTTSEWFTSVGTSSPADWIPQTSEVPAASFARTFFVSVEGNDTGADGSLTRPFATLSACISYIQSNYTLSASENASIQVSAGEFVTGKLIIPSFLSIFGQGYRTRITASNPNDNLLEVSGSNTIQNLLLSGVTNTSKYLIYIDVNQSKRVSILDVSFSNYETVGTVSNAIYVNSSSGTVTVRATTCDFEDISNKIIHLANNAEFILNGARVIDCATATILDATQNSIYDISNIYTEPVAVALNHATTGQGRLSYADFTNATTPIIKPVGSGDLTTSDVRADSRDFIVPSPVGISGNFTDVIPGDTKLRIFDELSVGLPGAGKESVFGEGDSYNSGMVAYEYNGSTYTDVTTEAQSVAGSTFGIPSGSVNSALYVSTQRIDGVSLDKLKWFGIKIDTETVAIGGEIVAEYWNGSSWIEFNHLSTRSSGRYYPYAKAIFQRAGSEQIRFDDGIDDDWTKNDPVGFGEDLYWVRFRVAQTLTTAPVFQSMKIHTNRTELNDDGYLEYFGKARPIESFSLPNFEAANNSPDSQDIYFSSDFGVGKIENDYPDNDQRRSGAIVYLPASVDTSCPLRLNIVGFNNGADPDPMSITISWIINSDGDDMLDSATGTNPKIQSKTFLYTPPAAAEKQFTVSTELDVSDYIADREDGTPDILGIQIQRNGAPNTNSDDWIIAVAQLFYTKHNEGSHH